MADRQTVAPVKAENVIGQLAVGERLVYRFPAALERHEARVRAFRMLNRDHPAENPMCWRVEE